MTFRTLTVPVLAAGVLLAGCAGKEPAERAAAARSPDDAPYATLGTREQVLAAAARQRALDSLSSGRTLEWRSPDGSAEGKITPTRSFRADGGGFCREFTEEVNAAGRSDRFTDLRCRTENGRWLRPKTESEIGASGGGAQRAGRS